MRLLFFYVFIASVWIAIQGATLLANEVSEGPGKLAFYVLHLAPNFTPEEQRLIMADQFSEPNIYYKNGKSEEVLPMKRNEFSSLLILDRTQTLTLYHKPQEPSEPVDVLAEISFDTEDIFYILVLYWNHDKNKLNARAFPISVEQSSSGSYTIINALDVSAAFSAEDHKGIVRPNSVSAFKFGENVPRFFKIEFFLSQDGKPKRFRKLNYRYNASTRYLAVMAPSFEDGSGKPSVYALTDKADKLSEYIKSLEIEDQPESHLSRNAQGQAKVPALSFLLSKQMGTSANLIFDQKRLSLVSGILGNIMDYAGDFPVLVQNASGTQRFELSPMSKDTAYIGLIVPQKPQMSVLLPDGAAFNKAGQISMHNNSPYLMAVAIDKKVTKVEPKTSVALPSSGQPQGVQVAFLLPQGWQTVPVTIPPFMPNQRALLLGMGDENAQSPDLWTEVIIDEPR